MIVLKAAAQSASDHIPRVIWIGLVYTELLLWAFITISNSWCLIIASLSEWLGFRSGKLHSIVIIVFIKRGFILLIFLSGFSVTLLQEWFFLLLHKCILIAFQFDRLLIPGLFLIFVFLFLIIEWALVILVIALVIVILLLKHILILLPFCGDTSVEILIVFIVLSSTRVTWGLRFTLLGEDKDQAFFLATEAFGNIIHAVLALPDALCCQLTGQLLLPGLQLTLSRREVIF